MRVCVWRCIRIVLSRYPSFIFTWVSFCTFISRYKSNDPSIIYIMKLDFRVTNNVAINPWCPGSCCCYAQRVGRRVIVSISWNIESKSDCGESKCVCICYISLLYHLCCPLLPTEAKWVTYSPLILPQLHKTISLLYIGIVCPDPETQMCNNVHGLSIHPSIFQIVCPV